jgi:hypothetical protein
MVGAGGAHGRAGGGFHANHHALGRRTATDPAIQASVCQLFLDWHAAQASTFPWEEEREGVQGPLLVRRQPVGVVGAIVPWNFPLALSFPKLAPALLTGCSVVLKPPEETPLFGFLLAEVFAEAGLPAGVLNVVAADREVSEALVEHPLVDKISFTGSTRAGRRIASLCGAQIKRCSLELGGKSAAIVLPDADLDAVVPALAPSTMTNNGQTCMNQTRVLAYRERYADVVDALRETIAAFPVGDPADPDVFIGPLVSDVQRRRVEGYIAKGREQGARLVLGGGRPDRDRGYFVQPTIFADVDNRMTIAQEEIFGPVVAVIPYDDEITPSPSPTTPTTDCQAACGVRTSSTRRTSRAVSGAATSRSTSTPWTSAAHSAASSDRASGGSTASRGSRSTSRSRASRTSGSPCGGSDSGGDARYQGLYGVLVRTVRISSSTCAANCAAIPRNSASWNAELITAPTALASSISQMSWTSLRSPITVLQAPTSFHPRCSTIGLALAIASLKAPSCPYLSLILEWR